MPGRARKRGAKGRGIDFFAFIGIFENDFFHFLERRPLSKKKRRNACHILLTAVFSLS